MTREKVTMERHPVKSTNIKSYGWKDSVLEIEYNGGGVYQYSGVPESVYHKLRDAASAGVFVNQHIKKNKSYRSSRVEQ